MPKNLLITGGAGYLGAVLVADCLRAGYEVTVVDNFAHNVDSLRNLAAVTGMHLIQGDVRDHALMLPLLQRTDAFLPLAGIVGAPACDQNPAMALAVNRDSIIWACGQLSQSQWVLFPSSCSVYGKTDSKDTCSEQSRTMPMSVYAKGKLEAEQAVLQKDNALSLRFATAYGASPRMRLDLLVNDFTYRAVHERFIVLFESHFKRDFIHVRDISGGFLHALKNFSKMKGQIFNCGLPEGNLSKLELCELIRSRLTDLVIVTASLGSDPDQRNYLISHDKMIATGFRAQYSLEMGIDEMIQTFSSQPGILELEVARR